jgi:hypothetical protein
LLIRALGGRAEMLGQQVGRLLTWNTMGAVAGVLLTGFVIMPQAGLRNAFGVLALGLGAVAILTAWRHQMPKFAVAAVGMVAVLTVLFALGSENWRHSISSGVFRARETEVASDALARRKQFIKIMFYEDAPDATVSVEKARAATGTSRKSACVSMARRMPLLTGI